MPVDSLHRTYPTFSMQWQRGRDTYAGSDAVKARGTLYLPFLEGHYGLVNQNDLYGAYSLRALFYPAVARTVAGLAGIVFDKLPTVTGAPVSEKALFDDVTLTGVSLGGYALQLCKEDLIVGRAGTLVDFPDVPVAGARPYLAMYDAESVINWRATRIDGKQTLTLLVLKEIEEVVQGDEFTPTVVKRFRVLRLIDGVYSVQLYVEDPENKGKYLPQAERIPVRRAAPLSYIPFTFLGPSNLEPDIDHPPLQDLVDVNLSHFRTSADQEHGAHFVALPTPWISGHAPTQPGEKISLGPGNVLLLAKDATAGMLEFGGQGLAALKDLKEEKRLLMATIGARMLETQKTTQEAAETVKLRHAGEQSALHVLADVLGQHLTQVVRQYLFWAGVDEARADQVIVTMNPDLMDDITSADMAQLVATWQAEGISKRTLYYNLEYGEWTRPGVTFEQEEEEIKKERAAVVSPPVVPAPATGPATTAAA